MAEISRIDVQLAKLDVEERVAGKEEIRDIASRGADWSQRSTEADLQRLKDLQSHQDAMQSQREALENRKREIYGSLDMAGEDIDVEAFGRSAEPLGTGQEEAIEEGEKKRENIFERAAKAVFPLGEHRKPKIGGGTRPEPPEEEDEDKVLAGSDTRKVDDMKTDLGLWRRAADAPEELSWGTGEDPVEIEKEKKGFSLPPALVSLFSGAAKGKDVDVPKEEPTVIVEDLPDGSETKDEGLDEETLKKIKQAEKELELEEDEEPQGVGR